MRSLTVTGPNEIGWEEVAEPQLPGPGGALVRPLVVATCDFDHLIISGRAPVPTPVQIGHELVGEVVAVGDQVRGAAVGDRVLVPFQISCGECGQCRSGRTSCCERVPWLSCYGLGAAAGDWGGAVADLVAVPYADAMLVAVPDGLAPELVAAAGCNLTDAYRCVGPQLIAEPGAPVLVVGEGFQNISLAAVAFATGLGAEQVDVLGLDPPRAEKARALGATVLESIEQVGAQAYPITVDASLAPGKLVAALRATAPGGVCTVSAMYPEPLTPVPMLELFSACATIHTGQPHVRGRLEEVLATLASGRIRTDLLIDRSHPWEHAADAYADPGEKAVIVREGEGG